MFRRKHKERSIIALILTALYLFIATPLSFWHHCDELENQAHFAKIEKTTAKDPKATIDKEAKKCLICGFEYSPIINNVVFASLPNIYSYPALFTQKILSKESTFNALHTNKGPPNFLG